MQLEIKINSWRLHVTPDP